MAYENLQQNVNRLNAAATAVKPKTITIDTRYKELYCQSIKPIEQESLVEVKHKQVFWNYMMNVSMQNAIAQMSKRTANR